MARGTRAARRVALRPGADGLSDGRDERPRTAQGGEANSSRQPRHPDDRLRHGRKRGRRDEGRRLRLRHQALLARQMQHHRRAGAQVAGLAGRESRAARGDGRSAAARFAQPRDDAAAGDREAGRRERRDHPADRRKRDRQKCHRAPDPSLEPASRAHVRGGELHHALGGVARKRALRSRAGSVHRRGQRQTGPGRGRRWRHRLPR